MRRFLFVMAMTALPASADPACDAAKATFVELATPETVDTNVPPIAVAIEDDDLRWGYVSRAYIHLNLRVRMETATPTEAKLLLATGDLITCELSATPASGDKADRTWFLRTFDEESRVETRSMATEQLAQGGADGG